MGHRMRQLPFPAARTLLLAAVLMATPTAHGTTRDLLDLSLEELGAIQITGVTLTPRNLGDVPAAVTVFTRAEIRQLPVTTVEQLMDYVPGFQSARSSDNSMSQPYSVRGRKLGVSGREVLVLINGMRIENFFTGGAAGTYPMIPLANVARVEFIRGPGSALYGSNAMTGMINIITEESESVLDLSAGTQDQYSGQWLQQIDSGTLNGSLFLQGLKKSGDDYRVQDTFSPQQIDTRDPLTSGDALLQLNVSESTRLQLLAVERNADDFYVTGFLSNGFNQYDTRYYHGMLEQTLAWSDAISSKLQAGYSEYTLEVDTQASVAGAFTAISSPTSAEPLKFLSEVVTSEAWVRWRNDWDMGNGRSLQFGLGYRKPAMESATIYGNFDLGALYRGEFPIAYREDFSNESTTVKPVDMDIGSAFAQYQSPLGEKADLLLGVRYDAYSQIGSAVSPRVALTLYPRAGDSIKLLYGRAFDAPVAAELYTINNTILLGNPDLKPETVDTWEVLWLHQGEHTTFSASYFYNRFHESITQAVVDGVRTYENSGHETSDGIELELIAQPHANLNLRATLTELIHAPDSGFRESEQLFSLITRLQQPFGYATLAANYQGEKQTLGDGGSQRVTLDAFWLGNLKLGYYAGQDLETYLEILNLADVDYATPSVTGTLEEGVPNPGRSARLGLLWRY